MTNLTDKQKANRAYHAKHKEEINTRKRESYNNSTETKPPKEKPARKKNQLQISNPENPPEKKQMTAEDRKKLQARRGIEDFKLAKELGIEGF